MKGFRQRVLGWALRRQGPDTLPLRLASRRIYILPTRAGGVFGLLLVAMFLAGMNYGNGLALLLTFWLASFALVAMVQTQRALTGLIVQQAAAEPAFAGEKVALTLVLRARVPIHDLSFRADHTELEQTVMRAPDRDAAVTLALPAPRRGRWRAPVLRLSTVAPYGLFRTWTWLSLDVQTLVYPKPAGNLPLPEAPGDSLGSHRVAGSHDELAALRPFREGDSPRQVAWKAYARGAPLLVREYQGQASARLEFDFQVVALADTEARLSQLARWILAAAADNRGWILRLPGSAPLAGADGEHRRACLGQLALFKSGAAP